MDEEIKTIMLTTANAVQTNQIEQILHFYSEDVTVFGIDKTGGQGRAAAKDSLSRAAAVGADRIALDESNPLTHGGYLAPDVYVTMTFWSAFKGDEKLAYFRDMSLWKKTDGKWVVVNEFTERI